MKKIVLLFVGVLVSASTFAGSGDGSATAASGMVVIRREATLFKVIYKSDEASDVKVQIFNEKNRMVFSETIKNSDGFMRPYNFEGLKPGEYTIRLDNGSNWMVETVSYGIEKVEKLAQLVRLADGKYMLTVAGQGENLLDIRVLDQTGKAIHTESIPVYGDFAQVYDLGKVTGSFSFEVTDKDGVSKTLTK